MPWNTQVWFPQPLADPAPSLNLPHKTDYGQERSFRLTRESNFFSQTPSKLGGFFPRPASGKGKRDGVALCGEA